MSVVSLVAIYLVLWWVAFMLTLPFGVRNAAETGEDRPLGSDPGAPPQPWLVRKMIVASLLALLMLAGVWLVFGRWGMRLDDFII